MPEEVDEKEVFMDIYCLHCKEETPHKVVYGPKFLKEMRCEVCGTVLRVDRKQMLKTYAAEFVDRVLTKPYRMKKELRGKELSDFILSLPIRIVSKPVRVAKEISEILKKK